MNISKDNLQQQQKTVINKFVYCLILLMIHLDSSSVWKKSDIRYSYF